jgi:hypothetical protein
VGSWCDSFGDFRKMQAHRLGIAGRHGPVAIRQPRVRDREAAVGDPDRIRFSPSILPPYMRQSKSIETLLPIVAPEMA